MAIANSSYTDFEQGTRAKDHVSSGTSIIHQHYYGTVNNVGHASNSNFGVNNGALIQNIGPSSSSGRSEGIATNATHPSRDEHADLLQLLNPILDASHIRNRALSGPNSACLPGTRKKVLKKIRSWVNSSLLLNNTHMLWIYGYAGCGKSAIAQAICKYFSERGRLAAAFFFFRGAGDRSRTARFATTIASQVAAAIPPTAPFIERAIKGNPGLLSITTTSLSDQFNKLVFQPISSVKWDRLAASLRHGPYLIVLDGLDECEDREEVAKFINHLTTFFAENPSIPLRFLIASRVESHIHQQLYASKQVRLLDLVEHTSDADILAALEAIIAEEKRGRVLACTPLWPSAEDKAKLVKHIGGSYIFLATVVRLLFDPVLNKGLSPMDRLPLVLCKQPDFDSLYKEVLGASQGLPHFRDIVCTIAIVMEPLSVEQVADFLEIAACDIVAVLVNLHTIMQIPGDDNTAVTLWHTSLRDFLCCEVRSGVFFADPKHHGRLAYRDATSGVPMREASSRYLRRFALDHLEKFLDTLDSVNSERESIASLLNGPIFTDGQTALEAASYAGRSKLARTLANLGVDVNVRFQRCEDGIACALHRACFYRERDMVVFLLDKGADPNVVGAPIEYSIQQFDGTPLTFAALEGDVELITLLLAHGADPNLSGGVEFSSTALNAASLGGSVEVVQLLLDYGAESELKDVITKTDGPDSLAQTLVKFFSEDDALDAFSRGIFKLTERVINFAEAYDGQTHHAARKVALRQRREYVARAYHLKVDQV